MKISRRRLLKTLFAGAAAVACGDITKVLAAATPPAAAPAALSIPFATLPINTYIRGPRYRVMFDRIITPKYRKLSNVDKTSAVKSDRPSGHRDDGRYRLCLPPITS